MNFSRLGFGIFSLDIYGILLAIVFTTAIWHYYKTIQQEKFPVNFFVHHFWRWVLAGIIGGRLLQVILDYEIIFTHTWLSFFAFWEGGVNFLGFTLAFIFALYHDTKDTQFSSWRWLDFAVMPFLGAIIFHDVASFITGNIYGTPTGLPWGIQYETFAVDIIDPVHPITLYALVLHGALFFWIRKEQAFYLRSPGKLFTMFSLAFIGIDFWLFFLRGDKPAILFDLFRFEQFVYIPLFIFLVLSLQKSNVSSK